jgi:hypothetical protein
MLANPKNCEMIVLKHDGSGRLQLDRRCEMEFETVYLEDDVEDSNDGTRDKKAKPITRVVGYAMHRRLKLLPPHLIQPRTARLFYGDNGL